MRTLQRPWWPLKGDTSASSQRHTGECMPGNAITVVCSVGATHAAVCMRGAQAASSAHHCTVRSGQCAVHTLVLAPGQAPHSRLTAKCARHSSTAAAELGWLQSDWSAHSGSANTAQTPTPQSLSCGTPQTGQCPARSGHTHASGTPAPHWCKAARPHPTFFTASCHQQFVNPSRQSIPSPVTPPHHARASCCGSATPKAGHQVQASCLAMHTHTARAPLSAMAAHLKEGSGGHTAPTVAACVHTTTAPPSPCALKAVAAAGRAHASSMHTSTAAARSMQCSVWPPARASRYACSAGRRARPQCTHTTYRSGKCLPAGCVPGKRAPFPPVCSSSQWSLVSMSSTRRQGLAGGRCNGLRPLATTEPEPHQNQPRRHTSHKQGYKGARTCMPPPTTPHKGPCARHRTPQVK